MSDHNENLPVSENASETATHDDHIAAAAQASIDAGEPSLTDRVASLESRLASLESRLAEIEHSLSQRADHDGDGFWRRAREALVRHSIVANEE